VIINSYDRNRNTAPDKPEDWELDKTQFDWLNETLRRSDKKWKFIISHHIVGGAGHYIAGYEYGDGGGLWSHTGGPTGQRAINHLMEEYNVQFFVFGHNHLFAHDYANWSDFDRINYTNYIAGSVGGGMQTCMPTRAVLWDWVICEKGYNRFTVSPYNVTLEFIEYKNGNVRYNHTLKNSAPIINLITPVGEVEVSEGKIGFTFNYSDREHDQGKNCTIYLDESSVETMFGVLSNTVRRINISSIPIGSHEWYVNCSDGSLSNISKTQSFYVIENQKT